MNNDKVTPRQPHQGKRFDPEGLRQMQGARLVYGAVGLSGG